MAKFDVVVQEEAGSEPKALDRCTCTHWHTWHLARERSGNFVGVNRGACVADGCGCDRFQSGG